MLQANAEFKDKVAQYIHVIVENRKAAVDHSNEDPGEELYTLTSVDLDLCENAEVVQRLQAQVECFLAVQTSDLLPPSDA